MNKTYEVTVRLVFDGDEECSAGKKVSEALVDICDRYNMTAFVCDDINYVGIKIQ